MEHPEKSSEKSLSSCALSVVPSVLVLGKPGPLGMSACAAITAICGYLRGGRSFIILSRGAFQKLLLKNYVWVAELPSEVDPRVAMTMKQR